MKNLISFLVLLLLSLILSNNGISADRYSVANGIWSSTAVWSTTSGGAPGASAPGSSDNAIIEGGFTVTLDAGKSATNVTVKNNSFLEASTFTLSVSGTFTLEAGATFKQGGTVSTVPGATKSFALTSNYIYNGAQNGLSLSASPTYGNLIFQPTPTTAGTFAVNLDVAGDFTINLPLSTYEVRFATSSTGRVHNIGGNLNIQGSSVVCGNNGTIATTVTIGGNLNINSGTTFKGTNSSGNITYNIKGNITNDGTWLDDDGSSTGNFTVNLNGISNQSISGANPILIEILTVNNSNGITLNRDLGVFLTLTLTSGKIVTGSNTFTLGSGITALGTLLPDPPTSSSYFVGNFERWFAASTVSNVYFPVGTATRYLPAIISYTSAPSTGGKLKVSGHTDDPLADNTEYLSDGGYVIDRYSSVAWWQFTPTTLDGGTYSLNLQGDGIVGADAVNYTKLRLLKRGNGSQTWGLSGTHAAATGNNTNPLVKRTGLTGFSEYGFGGYSVDGNGLGDNPLPVVLSSFSSSVINRNVRINWITLYELNNAGFEVERAEVRSQNLEFSKIGFINGHGTANTPTSYSFEDKNLNTGKYKYRLKQIDHNGNYEYFELNGEVEVGVPKKYDISQNYPNPFNPVTKINFDLPENGLVNIRLYDMLGREVAVLVNEVRNAGYYTVQFDASKLSSGIYFYKMNAGKFSGIKKMAVIK